jgi:hydrogenase maturation factor HypF (carbamoyltransferase family)
VNALFLKIKIMEEDMWICDECGKEFSYPNEGQIQQGFGICNKCGTNEDEI